MTEMEHFIRKPKSRLNGWLLVQHAVVKHRQLRVIIQYTWKMAFFSLNIISWKLWEPAPLRILFNLVS